MAVTGFSLLLAAMSALAGLAALALPADAGAGAAPLRVAEVPADELSDRLRPAETPPPDFAAAQYIDSAGCVFVRTDQGWRARVARDQTPVCGYPPTLSARRTDPDSQLALFPDPAEPQAQRFHRELTEAIIPNLNTGELAADADGAADGEAPAGAEPGGAPAGRAAAAPAVPGAAPMLGGPRAPKRQDAFALGEIMARAPVLSGQMTRPGHLDRVCALIGGALQEPDASALGLCGTPAASLAGLAKIAPVPRQAADTRQAAPKAESGTGKGGAGQASGRDEAAGAKPRKAATAARKAAPPADDPRMIPPGARYVQVGAFRDPGKADRTARELSAQGLPVVRSRAAEGQPQLIMVGPLEGREAIVRMIDRLGRAGYRNVVARR